MFKKISLIVLTIALTFSLCNLNSQTKTKSKTIENLQFALNDESNANAKYIVYAKKADQEGYKQVASLFRAIANSEEIHKSNQTDLLKKIGGSPKTTIKTPNQKSTLENLQDALKGENFEKDKMYPDFIKQARIEKNKDAIKLFNGAKTAEIEHAKLFADAIKNLSQMKKGKATYYVCPDCGYTVSSIGFAKCPVCYIEKDDFLKVN